MPDFIAASGWTSESPDLNALDYELWNSFEKIACQNPHKNLESPQKIITEAAEKIILATCTCIARWPERLSLCIDSKGGHLEQSVDALKENFGKYIF